MSFNSFCASCGYKTNTNTPKMLDLKTETLQSCNTSPFMYRTMLPTEGSGSYWFVNRSTKQQHSKALKEST